MFRTFDLKKQGVPKGKIPQAEKTNPEVLFKDDKLVADSRALDPFLDGEENESSEDPSDHAPDDDTGLGLGGSMNDFLKQREAPVLKNDCVGSVAENCSDLNSFMSKMDELIFKQYRGRWSPL